MYLSVRENSWKNALINNIYTVFLNFYFIIDFGLNNNFYIVGINSIIVETWIFFHY